MEARAGQASSRPQPRGPSDGPATSPRPIPWGPVAEGKVELESATWERFNLRVQVKSPRGEPGPGEGCRPDGAEPDSAQLRI